MATSFEKQKKLMDEFFETNTFDKEPKRNERLESDDDDEEEGE